MSERTQECRDCHGLFPYDPDADIGVLLVVLFCVVFGASAGVGLVNH